ncbi:TM2 domain-containing protein [Sporolactobacillus terrae]|uniref:TM2 domain-containing protein n=1 Tax=Sporolactobacillus terrae TaxID=269673 RepID=UPI00111B3D76|nr:TM2 domain-containing protein [Sporolactobacillus terrae]
MSMILSAQDQMLVNSIVAKKGKNKLIAYLLLLFLGLIGIHRFYLGKVGSGVAMLLLCWTGISLVWAIIDLFLLSGMVDRHNKKIEDEATQQILMKRAYTHD